MNLTNDGKGSITAGQPQQHPMQVISLAQALLNTPCQPL